MKDADGDKDTPSRTESDSMGSVRVPAGALYGAQTQRAVENFPLSGIRMPPPFLYALAAIKRAAALVNGELGLLDPIRAEAIAAAAAEVEAGRHDAEFPVDVFQTGSGTSTNMNANEVIAHRAAASSGLLVHPNDHVNLGQSSNDVIPTALHVSAAVELVTHLRPALSRLRDALRARAQELRGVVKTGRTHLMDALPVTFGQELGGWATQIEDADARIASSLPRLLRLALGGTAVGTGVNCPPAFAPAVVRRLAEETGIAFEVAGAHFAAQSGQDAAVEMSGQLRTAAVGLMKIANDLRWMNSGPHAGLGEIALPALQAGSSIMPGKVNPVGPEAVAMVCACVLGNDVTIAVAGQSGSFQLNTMLPLLTHALLQSIALLANAADLLATKAIAGFTVRRAHVEEALEKNPVLVTALNPLIGYELGAEIAKRAHAEGRTILDVAHEVTGRSREELARLLDPVRLAGGGRPAAESGGG